MLKITLNNSSGKKNSQNGLSSFKKDRSSVFYSETFFKEELFLNLRARILAITLFLYYFIENGTLGLVHQKYYILYRNMRISDFLLYGMVIYSIICYREIRDLVKSKSFFIVKVFLVYLLFEFVVSFIRYSFNPLEYFFRLKGVWTSFLVLPFLLLTKRNGFPFLIKLIFPTALISNTLYILSALTGIPFLPDVSIISQQLPGDIEVFRVFGGTFFGELYFLGIIYYWITKRFRIWQLWLSALFIIPHILAFGRMAWISFAFTILVMILLNSLNKRNYRILFRQALILTILCICTAIVFIKFIPESDYYIDALNARLFQGQEDVQYGEGTYGTRVITQNNALVYLWLKSDFFLGVGFHPMWVVGPESREEAILYGAFCDVSWPSVLAAYGVIGFFLTVYIQLYYIFTSLKILRNSPEVNLYTFIITLLFTKLVFDATIGFSYVLVSTGLWGLFNSLNIYIPVLVYMYEDFKQKGLLKKVSVKNY